mmetsp:Transcript_32204/g.92748  ORF Transcript_32204/g.92748 Transcript_32204/m.92748 type:complete len:275 (+) Transcript_32204:142-966(+)
MELAHWRGPGPHRRRRQPVLGRGRRHSVAARRAGAVDEPPRRPDLAAVPGGFEGAGGAKMQEPYRLQLGAGVPPRHMPDGLCRGGGQHRGRRHPRDLRERARAGRPRRQRQVLRIRGRCLHRAEDEERYHPRRLHAVPLGVRRSRGRHRRAVEGELHMRDHLGCVRRECAGPAQARRRLPAPGAGRRLGRSGLCGSPRQRRGRSRRLEHGRGPHHRRRGGGGLGLLASQLSARWRARVAAAIRSFRGSSPYAVCCERAFKPVCAQRPLHVGWLR